MTTPPVTRFAPSPTGFLHIGGARTALFNWAYAKGHGGRFLLRIEDTDRARSTPEAIVAILDGLRWLGLVWEGHPVMQAARAERHVEVAQQLLAAGHAYPCYATAEELAEMRDAARAAGKAPGYDGRWRDRSAAEWPAGMPFALRFRSPRDGETIIDDAVQGRVSFANVDLDDLIILRSDGTPTYNLSVIVDDHDMGVTQIIRGDDHLTNAARQAQMIAALGWPVPAYAHIPLIHGPDGAKLSKRHGALGVEAYRAMGYPPEALRNYLARLGWGHGDDEIFTTMQFAEWFDLPAVVRSPARLDFAKLDAVSGTHIRAMDDATLLAELAALQPYLPAGTPAPADEAEWNRLAGLIPALKPRAKTLLELFDGAAFLFAVRPLNPDAKAAALIADAGPIIAQARDAFAALAEWDAPALEAAARALAETGGIKLGDVAQPLRAALTGRAVSPPIFEAAAALGREESLARLADALVLLPATAEKAAT